MKKIILTLFIATVCNYTFAQSQITTTGNNQIDPGNPYAADIVIGSDANSGIRHNSSIMLWSAGSASRVYNTSDVFNFSVWNTTNPNVSLAATVGSSSYFQGRVGVGTTTPQNTLDVSGDIMIRNQQNVGGQGASVLFTPYADDYLHAASIRSYLYMAAGPSSRVGLILGSYWDGNKMDELTLTGGMVGVGTKIPDEKLTVYGNIHAQGVRVDLQVPYADYVFKSGYKLASLNSVETYIQENHHLPEIPAAEQVEKNGINLGEMDVKLLKKIEELTLYLIEKDKEIKAQSKVNNQLKNDVHRLTKQMITLNQNLKSINHN